MERRTLSLPHGGTCSELLNPRPQDQAAGMHLPVLFTTWGLCNITLLSLFINLYLERIMESTHREVERIK